MDAASGAGVTHTPLDWDRLIEERDTWVAHNFPTTEETAPMETIMGVFEEVGELTHAHLKARQSIRGSDEEHAEAAQDAVGDATVYLLGVLSYFNHRPREPVHKKGVLESDDCLLQAGAAVGQLFRYMAVRRVRGTKDRLTWMDNLFNQQCNKIVYYLFLYCDRRGWDYGEIVQRTWDEVKERDWIAYPDTGLPPDYVGDNGTEMMRLKGGVHDPRAVIRRMIHDWPFQPPEVINPEREAIIAAWLS